MIQKFLKELMSFGSTLGETKINVNSLNFGN